MISEEIKNEIIRLYIEERKSLREIAKSINHSHPFILNVLKNHGKLRTKSESLKAYFTEEEIKQIIHLYTIEKKTTHEIALIFKRCHYGVIARLLKKRGIKIRNQREAQLNYFTKPEAHIKSSESWVSSPKHGRGKHGVYNKIPYASTYELNYMRYLKKHSIKFKRADNKEYRIKYKFNNKEHYFYPDFYLKDTQTIVEIKSSYTFGDAKTKAKIKAAKKLLGNRFIIITEKEAPWLQTGKI